MDNLWNTADPIAGSTNVNIMTRDKKNEACNSAGYPAQCGEWVKNKEDTEYARSSGFTVRADTQEGNSTQGTQKDAPKLLPVLPGSINLNRLSCLPQEVAAGQGQ